MFLQQTEELVSLSFAADDLRLLSDADHVDVDHSVPGVNTCSLPPSQDCIQLNQYKLKSEIGKVSLFSAFLPLAS